MAPKRILLTLFIVATACVGIAVQAQEPLTGMFRMTRQPADMLPAAVIEQLSEALSPDEQLQWQVYVPEAYSPQRPAGLFVYIDPDGQGRIPDEWKQLFARHNMIWLGVRQTQRRTHDFRRLWQAILGTRAIEEDYMIDIQRMYVGGSRETVLTATNTMLKANEFSAGIYMLGSLSSGLLNPDQLQAMQRKHHVFITGSNDKQSRQIRTHYEEFQEDGIRGVHLIYERQRIGAMPSVENMEEAFRFFDARLRR